MSPTARIVFIAIIALLIAAAWVVVRVVDRGRPTAPLPEDADIAPDDMEAVMRALTVVQHNYAALVRENDDLKTRFRELQAERDHWRTQALRNKPAG